MDPIYIILIVLLSVFFIVLGIKLGIRYYRHHYMIRVYLVDKHKRVSHHWVKPDSNGTVTVNDMSFLVSNDNLYLRDNVPTFFLNSEDIEPQPVDLMNHNEKEISPPDFRVALKSNVTKQLYDAFTKQIFSTEFFVTLAILVGGFALTNYLVNEKINVIIETLRALGVQ